MKRLAQVFAVCVLLAGLSACNKSCKKKECAADPCERMEQMKKESNQK
ncbi:MAG: hypothetical protein ACKOAD_02810 [Gammaproteobacteria bacterium]